MCIRDRYQSCSIDYTWTTLSIYVSGSEITCVLILMGLLFSFCTILSSMADFLSILEMCIRDRDKCVHLSKLINIEFNPSNVQKLEEEYGCLLYTSRCV